MPKISVALVLIVTLLDACSGGPAQDAAEGTDSQGPVLEGPVRKVFEPMRLGDAYVHEGRLSWANEAFDFRPCNKDELHMIDASLSIHDTLDQAIRSQSDVNQTAIYVRFHGEVIAGVDGLPNRYADVVRITELLSMDASVPVICK